VTRHRRQHSPMPSLKGLYEVRPPAWGADPDPDGWLLLVLVVAAALLVHLLAR
jgi:hypothetical protein